MINHEVSFFATRNLVSSEVLKMPDPWNWDASKAPWHLEKPEWTSQYLRCGATDHRLIKLCEGEMPGVAIASDNQCIAIHGFIADYDGVIPTNVGEVIAKAPSGYLPAYVVETFSKKVRLVWLFERPLRVPNTDYAKRMLTYIASVVKARKWFADYDEKASEQPGLYLCIGRHWYPTKHVGYRISKEVMAKLDHDVYSKMIKEQRGITKGVEIPFEDIRAEAISRGRNPRIPKVFEDRAYCCRFWDPESDNETGCLITKAGVRVYVPHDKPFMSWADIFGREFTEKYESTRFNTAVLNAWYDKSTQSYWTYDEVAESFAARNTTNMSLDLRVAGFSRVIPKGDTASDIDRALHKIAKTRQVDRAAQYLYHTPGPIKHANGSTVLNISTIKPVEPSAPQVSSTTNWHSESTRQAFPFIWGCIHHQFDLTPIPGWADGAPTQAERFLWWLAWFYKCSYTRARQAGQALFIAGNVGQGKSFLSRHLIPTLMGGVATSASAFLTGQSRWTSELVGQPTLNVDDDATVADVSKVTHLSVCCKVKEIVANGVLTWAQKFGAETEVPWYGRPIITCNLDRRSTRIIPVLDEGNRDKMTFLLSKNSTMYPGFGTNEYNIARLREELPAFARFLFDLEIPEEYRDMRFGVVAWQHPALVELTRGTDSLSALVEALDCVFKDHRGGEEKYWEGSSQELYKFLTTAFPGFTRDYVSSSVLGRELVRMEDSGWDVHVVKSSKTKYNRWRIAYDIANREVPEATTKERE
jgi:hypothetical protein